MSATQLLAKALRIGIAASFLATGCTEQAALTTGALLRPVDMATFCVQEASCTMNGTPLAECTEDSTACGVISNAELGDLALVQLSSSQPIDGDPFVPGVTRRTIGGVPGAVILTPDHSGILTVDSSSSEIVRIETADWWAPATRQILPAPAHEIIAANAGGEDILLVPIPSLQRIVHFPIEELGNLDLEQLLESHSTDFPGVPGRPVRVPTEEGDTLWFAHTNQAAVSVFDPIAHTLLTIPLAGECLDGLDNDVDGLLDEEDPECVEDMTSLESGATPGFQPSLLPDIAITPKGDFIYVTDRLRRQIHVIDTDTLEPIDVNVREGEEGHPVHASNGRRGVVLPNVPAAIAFATSTVEVDGEEVTTQTAFISTTSGLLHLIDATVGDEPRHLRRASQDALAILGGFPLWTIDGEVLATSFSTRADLPNLGPFGESEETDNPHSDTTTHGIAVSPVNRHVEGEVWTLTHEGALPGSLRNGGELVDDPPIFDDPSANYCSLGVEAGDTLVITPASVSDDSDCDPWRVDHLEFLVTEVSPTTLTLESSGACAIMDLEIIDDEGTALALPPTSALLTCGPFERLESTRVAFETVGFPPAKCIEALQSSRIRVPRGTFLVAGSSTGHLHPWRRIGDACVPTIDAPLIQGRAFEAIPLEGAPLQSCDLPLDDALFSAETPFANPIIAFTIRPGCDVREEEIGPELVPSPRDVSIQFSLNAGFIGRVLNVGGIVERVRTSPIGDLIHLIDTALNRVLPLDPVALVAGLSID
jgi:hypothetical protein